MNQNTSTRIVTKRPYTEKKRQKNLAQVKRNSLDPLIPTIHRCVVGDVIDVFKPCVFVVGRQ